MIDYNIIATGSKGNAVVIDQKILIDAPFCVLCMAVQAAGGCRGAGLAD